MFSVHTVSTVQKFGMKTKNTEKEASWAQQNQLNWLQSKSQGMRLFEHRFFRAFTVGLGQSLFGAFGKRDSVGWCFTFPEQISGSAHISWRIDVFFFAGSKWATFGLMEHWETNGNHELIHWIHWRLEILHHIAEEIERIWFFASKWQQWMSCRPTRQIQNWGENWAFSYESLEVRSLRFRSLSPPFA